MNRTARITLTALALLVLGTGCTVVNTAVIPSDPRTDEIFLTAGDLQEPHEVLGVVQATRAGVLLLGNFDVVGTDLEAGFRDVLIPQIRELGGDGATRVRFHMTQYTPVGRVLGAIFFFAPLPSRVTVTAQVVKRTGDRQGQTPPQGAPQNAPPAPQPPGI